MVIGMIVILTYAVYQLSILVSLDQYNVISSVQENYYEANEPLKEQFKVAAALTSWGTDQEPIE